MHDSSDQHPERKTNDANAILPAQTARRARAAREQGHHAIHTACCLDARDARHSCVAAPLGARAPPSPLFCTLSRLQTACCLDARPALAALALLLLSVLVLLLFLFCTLSRPLLCLQCLTLSRLSRFPFHDSQVLCVVIYEVFIGRRILFLVKP